MPTLGHFSSQNKTGIGEKVILSDQITPTAQAETHFCSFSNLEKHLDACECVRNEKAFEKLPARHQSNIKFFDNLTVLATGLEFISRHIHWIFSKLSLVYIK